MIQIFYTRCMPPLLSDAFHTAFKIALQNARDRPRFFFGRHATDLTLAMHNHPAFARLNYDVLLFDRAYHFRSTPVFIVICKRATCAENRGEGKFPRRRPLQLSFPALGDFEYGGHLAAKRLSLSTGVNCNLRASAKERFCGKTRQFSPNVRQVCHSRG